MLRWTITFFILAIVAGLLGFGLIANLTFAIAKILFYIFVALFILSLVFGKRTFKSKQ